MVFYHSGLSSIFLVVFTILYAVKIGHCFNQKKLGGMSTDVKYCAYLPFNVNIAQMVYFNRTAEELV